MINSNTSITYEALWKKSSSRPTPTADGNLGLIIGSVTHLPPTESIKLRFMGEVAAHDIHSIQKGA